MTILTNAISGSDSDGARGVGKRLVIGIPTAGRPDILAATVKFLESQTRRPDLVVLSVSDPAHTGGIETADLCFPVVVLVGPKGLSRQRNAILETLQAQDILLFLDDDFLMAPDYLDQLEQIFDSHPDVVLTTGSLIADGILGPGLNFEQGLSLLTDAIRTPAPRVLKPSVSGYGCNMAIRAEPVLAKNIRFDERLPLYSWLEDADFSAQLRVCGRFVQPTMTRGVHLGTKTGRTPGLNLGYSQIANPVYLLKKGTFTWPRAIKLMTRNMGSNVLGTVSPRPWADYRGRLIGNLTALFDLCIGRCDPERILGFSRSRTFQEGRWRKTAP